MSKIIFYPSDTLYNLFDVSSLIDFFKHHFEIEIRQLVEEDYLEDLIDKILLCKVSNPFAKEQPVWFFEQEKVFEESFLKTQKNNLHLYNGFLLQEIYRDYISYKKTEAHIIFSRRIICSYDEVDHRYHNRVVILGYPCIISIAGLLNALSLPKEYYILRNNRIIFSEEVRKQIVELIDKNLVNFLTKYIFQCLFYIYFGIFNCEYKECFICDNHWFLDVYQQIKLFSFDNFHKCFCNKHIKSFLELTKIKQ